MSGLNGVKARLRGLSEQQDFASSKATLRSPPTRRADQPILAIWLNHFRPEQRQRIRLGRFPDGLGGIHSQGLSAGRLWTISNGSAVPMGHGLNSANFARLKCLAPHLAHIAFFQ